MILVTLVYSFYNHCKHSGYNDGRCHTRPTLTGNKCSKQLILALAFIIGANHKRYRHVIQDLENSLIHGDSKYPLTCTAAYNLLVSWRQDPCNLKQITNQGDGSLLSSFLMLATKMWGYKIMELPVLIP